jgi:subtilisin family serine protease
MSSVAMLGLACSDTARPTGATGDAPEDGLVLESVEVQSPSVPDRYIITFADSVADVPGLARRFSAQVGETPEFTYVRALKGFAARIPAQALPGLARNPQIVRIEQDQVIGASGAQSGAIWNLDRLDQRTRPLDGTYSFTSDGAGVNAYIIDSGIRTSHAEFGGRATGVFTAVSDGRGTNDCTGHGTHVAGTVGGTRYGVAKGVKLLGVRVFDCSGYASWSGVIAALDWITANRVLPAVANLSLEGPKSATVNAAVQAMIDAGVTTVVAAGNDAGDACGYTPASAPAALTVGSTWNFDGMSGFSNYGACVDLFAPGEAIRSASYRDDTSSVVKGGTSMSSPHVAGVAALYLSANPTATPAQVSAAILGGATRNVLTDVPSGTANLLLYSQLASGTTAPDTTTPPAAPPPPPAPAPPPPATPAPPAPIDLPPTAIFTTNCPHGKCSFDASRSTDDHGVTSYSWSFGDGSAGTSAGSLAKATHTYTVAGSYTVTLTVRDSLGQTGTASAVLKFKKL